MKPERWQQLDKLFNSALELDRKERAQFLDEACVGNVSLRREVEALLAAHQSAGSFIENPALEVEAQALAGEQVTRAPNTIKGQTIGHYRIIERLGAGGMGEVYLAQDLTLGRQVALKLLPAHFTEDAQRLRRFEQEARSASALNHPNILTIYEIGHADSVRYIATEFIDGVTLSERIADRPMETSEALDVAVQVASALTAAHAKGIVHRDIKPDNIMISQGGHLAQRENLVKVLDFGIAKLTDQTTGEAEAITRVLLNTHEGSVIGTASYMSPEQARGDKVDVRTDIWSLGIVLYEMLSNRRPFEGDSHQDIIASILKEAPPPLPVEVPDRLKWIVEKALRKNREERYQTSSEMFSDLREVQRQSGNAIDERTSRTGDDTARENADTQASIARPTPSVEYIISGIKNHKATFAAGLAVLLLAALSFAYRLYTNRTSNTAPIQSLAVLPFINESGNSDVEYLSDGMTESLINSLSQLPNLAVKARGAVFRYKGRDLAPQQVGSELSVQAVLSGRVVQRGDQLTLSLELVDVRTANQIWGDQYHRKLTDLIALQSEITHDVLQKLRVRLSGAEEQKLAKNYTANPEAYQLYLKGRYHLLKVTRSEVQTSLSLFQQAIAVDPSYALAYVGLASAYRALALGGELLPTEFFPKAKAAAQKALDIDDRLAEAHAELGFIIFRFDWDWNAAENECKRALELDPNSADAHLNYAQLLSYTGRHAQALAEAKRARELDPLNVRTNALEGELLTYAGRTDEALDRLQKTFELDPNLGFAHIFASSAYIEKGMYGEAITEARRAKELSPVSTYPLALLGYALAKSGKRAEARAVLEELLRSSAEHYIPPYHIALVYNGLDDRDDALAWLERGFEQREPKMTFLKVEPKWNNLRGDPRFQDLMRRVGFKP